MDAMAAHQEALRGRGTGCGHSAATGRTPHRGTAEAPYPVGCPLLPPGDELVQVGALKALEDDVDGVVHLQHVA